MLLMLRPGSNQHQIEAVQYISLFNVPTVENLIKKTVTPLPSIRNDTRHAGSTKIIIPEAISNSHLSDLAKAVPNAANTDTSLNLETLRGQAVQIELTRIKSDIEKMNDSKKLNLSIEAKLDRELNKIVLPECGAALMGKLMPERMMIIQNHSKKKFCK